MPILWFRLQFCNVIIIRSYFPTLGVAAFSPVVNSKTSMALSAKSKSLPFLEEPEALKSSNIPGNVGFDPVGFSSLKTFKYGKEGAAGWQTSDWGETVIPEKAAMWSDAVKRTPVTTLEWMREAEIKHGRFAMLATVGWIAVDLGLRFPFYADTFAAIPNSLKAHDLGIANGSML